MAEREPELEHAADEPRVGLCSRCQHARTVKTSARVYWLCERSRTDASFDKYPRLPVLTCPGYELKV